MFNERIERDIGKQSSCKLSGAIYNGMKDLWDVSS